MKRFGFYVLMVLLLLSEAVTAQKRKERKEAFNSSYNYEIHVQAVGVDGTKVYKVWGYGKKVEDAILNARRCAVAAVIFKEVPGSAGVESTPALCSDSDAAERHAGWFDRFFAYGGAWQNYVNLTTDAVPSGKNRLKTKDGYKVGIIVQVLYDQLRKELEKAGIAKKMDYLF